MLSILLPKPVYFRIKPLNAQGRRKMATNALVVHTSEGKVRGKELCATSFSKKKYFAFLGIPYAKPPVGNLRFKDPQPLQPWEGVRDALQEAQTCPQKHIFLKELVGEEDNCLGLNVFTKQLGSSAKAASPVIVWFHGGGFTFGSGNMDLHDPDYWMEKDVVIVTCNYRVGALGFLALGTEEVPGNAGLKDQVMVLRWIHRNIANFGGDAANVTLMGASAGAASVHFHLFSPMSRGLFHRAILMSGCGLSSWAFSNDAVEKSHNLAKHLGSTATDPQSLLDFLQTIPAFDLVQSQRKVLTAQDKQNTVVFPFIPCVEPATGAGERFLTEHPRALLRRGEVAPVPIIIGANDQEGMMALNDYLYTDDFWKVLNGNFGRIVPGDLGLPKGADEIIRKEFFSDRPIGWDTINSFIDYFGDILFYIGLDESILLHLACAKAPVYCYQMSFDGQLGLLSFFLRQIYPQCNFKGVSHADDLGYIFKCNIPGPPKLSPGSPEEEIVSLITGTCQRFAVSGDPNLPGLTEKWEPAVQTNGSWRGFLDFNIPLQWRDSRLQQGRMDFWDTLLQAKTMPLQKL